MGYSKESERQNKVLGDLLSGREPDKRVMIGYEGKGKEKGDVIPKMTELMQDVRMPLFCPSCNKVMKKRLDDKMWRLYEHCFDCQLDLNTNLDLKVSMKSGKNKKLKKIKYLF